MACVIVDQRKRARVREAVGLVLIGLIILIMAMVRYHRVVDWHVREGGCSPSAIRYQPSAISIESQLQQRTRMQRDPFLVAIVAPAASGRTGLSLRLAERF